MTFDISDLGGVCGRDQAWRSSDSRGLSRAIDLGCEAQGGEQSWLELGSGLRAGIQAV